jgi:hypothetical protein
MKLPRFDKLPAVAQHVVVAFLGAFGFAIVDAITKAGGVTGIDWAHKLIDAFNAGAVAAGGVVMLFWITPLTRQYGLSKVSNDGASVADVVTDPVTPPQN